MVASSLVVLPLGCDDDEAPGSGKPLIISSIFPIHDLVRQVAGDGFACEAILTPGQSAHDFQPSPKLAKTVARAKAAMVVGLELDPWAKKLAEAAGGVKVTELGASADPKTFEVDRLGGHGHGDEHDHGKGHDHDDHDHGDHGHGDHGHGDHGRDKGHDHAKGHDDHGHDDHGRGKAHDHDEGHDHDKAHGHDHEEHGSASHGDHGHDHGGPDPHVWLSVPRAKKLVTAISAALATADPAQKAAVETNAGKVQLELDALHGDIGKKNV